MVCKKLSLITDLHCFQGVLGPLTDVEKLRCLTLAPTAKLESKESLFEVAGALLLPSGCTYPDKTSFTGFMVDRFTEVGIVEYKPVVDLLLIRDVNERDLLQVLMEAYYCLCHHQLS